MGGWRGRRNTRSLVSKITTSPLAEEQRLVVIETERGRAGACVDAVQRDAESAAHGQHDADFRCRAREEQQREAPGRGQHCSFGFEVIDLLMRAGKTRQQCRAPLLHIQASNTYTHTHTHTHTLTHTDARISSLSLGAGYEVNTFTLKGPCGTSL